uniref:Candidate secreted effector n=1 Tax=Meloidogyne incognita TaxID=6306 RepID=A0A914M878_MELIC
MSTSENNEQKPVKINGITNGKINENGKINGIAKDTNAQIKTPTTNGTNSVNGVVAMNSPKRCAPKLNTQERLFGSPLPETPKKKVIEKHRSTIFDTSAPSSPSRTPKKCVPIIERNPITGEIKIPKNITM